MYKKQNYSHSGYVIFNKCDKVKDKWIMEIMTNFKLNKETDWKLKEFIKK